MLVYFYNKVPKPTRDKIGKSKFFKWIRDLLLRKNGSYRERTVLIKKDYLDFKMAFKFVASIKDAAKASKYGVENTMIRNSIKLIRKYKSDINDAVIFDIGANFGYLSLVWTQTISQSGKVIAFEPSKNVFNSLSKSIQLNDLKPIVTVENLALGNQCKQIELYLNNTTSNVLKLDESQRKQMVQMLRLDDYIAEKKIKRCDLIKIDVDGIEMDILKGSLETLKQLKPLLIVETNNDVEIIDFFTNNNYTVLDEKLEVYKAEDTLPLNVYCVPNI